MKYTETSDAARRRVYIWLTSFLFFILATPFELNASGAGYLIKSFCALGLWIIATHVYGARFSSLNLFVAFPFVCFIAANVFEPSLRAAIAAIAMAASITLGTTQGQRWFQQLNLCIKHYLWIHLVGFVLSLAAVYLFSIPIDLHGLIFPMASRSESLGMIYRLGGLHTEPGTYAQWMYMALFLKAMLERRILSHFNIAVIASILLTLSVWALFAVIVYLLAVVVELAFQTKRGQLSRSLAAILVASAIALLFWFNISPDAYSEFAAYVGVKSELRSESGYNKVMGVYYFQDKLLEIVFIGKPIAPGLCPSCISPQDIGLMLNSMYYFGVVAFVLLMLAFFGNLVICVGIPFVVMAALVTVWKAAFYDPLWWVIVCTVLSSTLRYRKSGEPALGNS